MPVIGTYAGKRFVIGSVVVVHNQEDNIFELWADLPETRYYNAGQSFLATFETERGAILLAEKLNVKYTEFSTGDNATRLTY